MKLLKRLVLTIGLLCIASMMAMADQVVIKEKISVDVIVGIKQPSPSQHRLMLVEEAAHPNMVKAMHNIEIAMKDLDAAPDNFGGRKAQAQEDLKKSYQSIRRALYFRLYEETH